MKTEAGNALLITMVVITVIGTVGFGVSRTAVSSLRNQNRLEDSANAYQAASAGIEDGLLRWRFNKDVEVPAPGSGSDCVDSPHETSALYTRVNLTEGIVTECIDPQVVASPDANEIVYDIKMTYRKTPGESEVVASRPAEFQERIPALRQDEVVEYNVSQITKRNEDVKIQLTPDSTSTVGNLLEVTMLDGKGREVHKKVIRGTELQQMVTSASNLGLVSGTERIRLKYKGQNLTQYEIQPLSTGTGSNAIALDGRISYVDVVGYFGSAKRKLRLSLDRFSGSTLDLFDYVLFSQGVGDIAPPQ